MRHHRYMSSKHDATAVGVCLVTSATMAAVDKAEAYASAFCRQQEIGPRLERVLLLILEELVTNTVTHGLPPAGSNIDVTLRRDESHISLFYCDRGIAFDPLHDREQPDFTQTMRSRALGGVGWPLIFHYCSDVQYRRRLDVNELELTVPLLEAEST